MTARCHAPERHPDGCACVRPGEEPATWPWLTLNGQRFPPEGLRVEAEALLRQMSEAGEVVMLPEGAEMRLVGKEER
ncbi:hypothetical protein WMF30_10285 [Sorangium sp. So ce134]